MNTDRRFGFWRVLACSLGGALHWRVLVLWLVALGVVALIAAFPVWAMLDASLSQTLDAARLATGIDAVAFGDLMHAMDQDTTLRFGVLVSLLLSLLLSPWLTGVILAAIRQGKAGRLGSLAGEGMREYGRQLRLLIWSLIPFGIAVALGAWWMNLASGHAETAVLVADAKRMSRFALVGAVAVFVLMHVTIELARARIAVRDDTRSVIRAWWRGLKLLLRRPFAVLGLYLLVSVAGLVVVLLLGWLRVGMAGIGAGQFVLAVLCGQLVVAAMAWMKFARLRALARVVDDEARRQAG